MAPVTEKCTLFSETGLPLSAREDQSGERHPVSRKSHSATCCPGAGSRQVLLALLGLGTGCSRDGFWAHLNPSQAHTGATSETVIPPLTTSAWDHVAAQQTQAWPYPEREGRHKAWMPTKTTEHNLHSPPLPHTHLHHTRSQFKALLGPHQSLLREGALPCFRAVTLLRPGSSTGAGPEKAG